MRKLLPATGVIFLSLSLFACDLGGGTGDGGTGGVRIGGVVTGLQGEGLALVLNGGAPLPITESGVFNFPQGVGHDSEYNVTVGQQPANPAQACVVVNGSGVAASAVVDVTVNCETVAYAIGGTIQNLRGDHILLRNNGGPTLKVLRTATGTATFTFPERLPTGSAFDIQVEQQPLTPSQTCQVTANGAGTVGTADVSNIVLDCAETPFTVGGTAVGLLDQPVTLQINGGDPLVVRNGDFTFSQPLLSGADYVVTIQQPPADRLCSLHSGSGKVGDGPVNTVWLVCGPTSYTVAGGISGLDGSGLVLRNNGSDDLPLVNDGGFAFPTAVAGGMPYYVTVASQPTNPWQTCLVNNGAGPGTGNVSNVQVECATNRYRVGGTITGLRGSGLYLMLNGTFLLVQTAGSASFQFTPELLSGSAFEVTVWNQPFGQTCTVNGGAGVITSGDVTSVSVECVTPGDTRDNALDLDLSLSNFSFQADTRYASNEDGNLPACACSGGPDLFYRFELTVPSIVYADTFETVGRDDALLLKDENGALVSANLTGGEPCSDDACGTAQAQVTARLNPGIYYLVVAGCGDPGATNVRFHHQPAPAGELRYVTAGWNVFNGALDGSSTVSGCYDTQAAEDAYWWRTCPTSPAGSVTATTCYASTAFETVLDFASSTGASACVNATCGLGATLATSVPGGAGMHMVFVDALVDPQGGSYVLQLSRP